MYGQSIAWDTDFDERYFINLNGLQHTPIKLKSPLQNFPFSRAAKTSVPEQHKSPLVKSSSLSKIAEQNYAAQKRARGGDVQLKFVTPEEVDGAE